MAAFEFSASGNFSRSFGWDNSATPTIGVATDHQICQSDYEDWVIINTPATYNTAKTFSNKYGRGFYFCNENGGSRNIWGEVLSYDKTCAEKALKIEMEEMYPYNSYIPEGEYQNQYCEKAMRILMPWLFVKSEYAGQRSGRR